MSLTSSCPVSSLRSKDRVDPVGVSALGPRDLDVYGCEVALSLSSASRQSEQEQSDSANDSDEMDGFRDDLFEEDEDEDDIDDCDRAAYDLLAGTMGGRGAIGGERDFASCLRAGRGRLGGDGDLRGTSESESEDDDDDEDEEEEDD